MPYEVTIVDVIGSPMEVFRFRSADPPPVPGILLAQHIPIGHTGLENDTFTLAAAERLARNGYDVAVPFIFHWWPKSESIEVKRAESRDDWSLADCRAAFDLLATDERVHADRVGVVGHCWGGRVAWLAAAGIPELAACAIFYGGRIKQHMGEGQPPAISLAPAIRCPVAGFFGNDDVNPTPADVDDYADALGQAGVPHTFYRYDNAGHAFQNFPDSNRYREAASDDAWRRLLEFLVQTLA